MRYEIKDLKALATNISGTLNLVGEYLVKERVRGITEAWFDNYVNGEVALDSFEAGCRMLDLALSTVEYVERK